ncbi:hypothetical protein [Oceanospirillum sanctuarii]|uniref:hypothetical protein n=1 Tax=Oceanospirillum sanctuarii TaxID=1434821 RepID=UPI000A378F78|nr:hypothetical protein [Oceanospirillum sanctuarii]
MKFFVLIIRIFAVPSVLMTILIAMDIALPYGMIDRAVVYEKYANTSKQGSSYNIKASGTFSYNEAVSKSFYERVEKGDILKVNLSQIFMEWKSVELIKSGNAVVVEIGTDIYYLGILGLVFLLTIFSFKPIGYIRYNKPILIGIPVLEVMGFAIFCKVLLFMFGYIDKV